jgi:hypothetical protein
MNPLISLQSPSLPALIVAAGERAQLRFLEFFASNIRNPHTRRAYVRAVAEFLDWCAAAGVAAIEAVQPLHVAAWIEGQTRQVSAPTVKRMCTRRTGGFGCGCARKAASAMKCRATIIWRII